MAKFIAACIQLNSQRDVESNIQRATVLIRRAVMRGAAFVALPENAFFMGGDRNESKVIGRAMEDHRAVLAMQKLSQELNIWLLFGVAVAAGEKLANRSVLINPEGKIASYYEKIHLFDVDIIGGESHRESEVFKPGEKSEIADLPWGKLGMTICYDLRFPHLFRKLAQDGAKFITVPSAFTLKTGEAHWNVLLRARAIENACYIIAPAQVGEHPRGRKTYGHSMIIDPWGKVLAESTEEKEEAIIAEIETDYVEDIRHSLPS